MDKNIFEEGPRRGHAAGDTSIEQQASQLASDIKYKARQKMKGTSGSNMSPGQVQQLYRSLLGSSTAPGGVKAIVKKKLFGEQIDLGITPVSEHLEGSSSEILTRVFSEAEEKKFVIRVTDKATGNTSYRKADRAKIAQLRANPNISSVEITGRKEVDDAYKGDPKPNYGGKKAKKDYDGDGKIESGTAEYMGSRDKAIKKAMAKEETLHEDEYRRELARERRAEKDRESKRFGAKSITPGKLAASTGKNYADSQMGSIKLHDKLTKKNKNIVGLVTKEEVIYEKEENDDKKIDVMKGKNSVKINPSLGESIKAELDALKAQRVEEAMAAAKSAGPSPEEKQQLMNKDKMLKKKIMMQKQIMQMQKQGRLPLNYSEECEKCGGDHDTKDHDGKKAEKDGTFDALRTMKPDAEKDDPRSMKTKINLAKNKLRAMGLKMSYDMEGEMTEELSIDQQMKISREYNRMSPEEKKAAVKKALSGIKKGTPKKDTRTDAQKMTDATGPRPGSRYRGD